METPDASGAAGRFRFLSYISIRMTLLLPMRCPEKCQYKIILFDNTAGKIIQLSDNRSFFRFYIHTNIKWPFFPDSSIVLDGDAMPDHDPERLTGGRLLAKNTVLNLVGQGAPMIVAIFTIPFLIEKLGTDRFGILTIAWIVISYFSFFDLGLGRALTKIVAEKLGSGEEGLIPGIVWSSLFFMLVFGMLGTIVVVALTPWLTTTILKIPAELQVETEASFYILAFSIPVVVSTAGLAGLLQAFQRFDLFNAIRIPMGLFTFLGPLLVLPFTQKLGAVVMVLVAGRLIAWVVHLYLCLRIVPALRHSISIDVSIMKPLLGFGGWMTVANIFGPFLVYIDRFFIGALVSVAAVAYYTTPYDVISKLIIIPGAVVGVLFPAFSTSYARDPSQAAHLFARATKYIFIIMFPLTLVIVAFSYEGLHLWLGADFALHSMHVLRLLTLCIFINSLAQVPFVLIQGMGRPAITARILLIQLPFYLPALYMMITYFGINGAAAVMLARVIVDTLLLFIVAGKILPHNRSQAGIVMISVAAAIILLIAFSITSVTIKIAFVILVLSLLPPVLWALFLEDDERHFIKETVKRYRDRFLGILYERS